MSFTFNSKPENDNIVPISEEENAALDMAFNSAVQSNPVDFDVNGEILKGVDPEHLIKELEALCWGRPKGSPLQRGAQRLLRGLARAGIDATVAAARTCTASKTEVN